ncbi:heterokaryon incompatibility protein 6, OR allele [Aspergillus udagawae]|uniref:Heterokaryon incompatibility protein 6, OR allele n=1 Tax=Aspergillus udagawae TaxID=91492 RepID=A0ABQ1B348_9EURO|nr:heterokaryon incompatibility protein 6, OR allele [Aspergillus udagawae]GFF92861.1 heterokaryon incompatibility protein 6, OR allele [Aspergillus udagawae]
MSRITPQTNRTFDYEPLLNPTSIRLLRVDHKDPDGVIHCTIKTVNLNDAPLYHAMSYTWGNPHSELAQVQATRDRYSEIYPPEHRECIFVNGRLLYVTRSAHDALVSVPRDAWAKFCNRGNRRKLLRTSLHWASIAGKQELIQPLLCSGVDVNVRDEWEVTPLSYAAQVGSREGVKLLLSAGADARIADNQGKTPLDYARQGDYKEIIRCLEEVEQKGGSLEARVDWPEGPERWCWIDQICINQNDIAERGAQVAIMDQIYKNASFTLVWLGPEDSYTDMAIKAIEKLDTAAGDFIRSTEIQPYREQPEEVYAAARIPYVSIEEWTSFAALFLRPYFRRLWIVQESILSDIIMGYCGSHEIPWKAFHTVAQQIYFRQELLGRPTSTAFIAPHRPVSALESEVVYLTQWRERLQKGNKATVPREPSLENLIFDTWTFNATDPRDKIFGLYGLLREGGTVDWQPDYSQSVGEVFARATKEIIQKAGELRILSAVHDESLRNITDLPSWVPDYSTNFCNMMCANHHAAGDTPMRSIIGTAWNKLPVAGVKFDSVLAIGNTTSGPGQMSMFFDQRWLELALLLPVPYHTGETRTEALWRTLCADQALDGSTPAPSSYGDSFKAMVCSLVCVKAAETARASEEDPENVVDLLSASYHVRKTWSSPPLSELSAEELTRAVADAETNLSQLDRQTLTHLLYKLQFLGIADDKCFTPSIDEVEKAYYSSSWLPWDESETLQLPREGQEFYNALRRKHGRRRLFVTANRYLGLGPAAMAVGDEVWLLAGSGAAMVLRGTESEDVFRLVGAAYVHGIMNGEQAGDDMKLQDITLV